LATANETARTFGKPSWWPFQDKPWQHTAHTFGFLARTAPGSTALPIQHAGNIAADPALKNGRIKITLDRLRVSAYPGGGMHRVLFDFYAQNQVPGEVEHLHFNATRRVREGQQAAILGYPIFVGLNVGSEGVAFKCFTINVRNDQDEAFLGFLDSDVFKVGLKLASTAQPAIAPFSQMALGLTKGIAAHNRNVPVQDFYLGLDFSAIPTRARLAEGSYLAVQIPESQQTVWDWYPWDLTCPSLARLTPYSNSPPCSPARIASATSKVDKLALFLRGLFFRIGNGEPGLLDSTIRSA